MANSAAAIPVPRSLCGWTLIHLGVQGSSILLLSVSMLAMLRSPAQSRALQCGHTSTRFDPRRPDQLYLGPSQQMCTECVLALAKRPATSQEGAIPPANTPVLATQALGVAISTVPGRFRITWLSGVGSHLSFLLLEHPWHHYLHGRPGTSTTSLHTSSAKSSSVPVKAAQRQQSCGHECVAKNVLEPSAKQRRVRTCA